MIELTKDELLQLHQNVVEKMTANVPTDNINSQLLSEIISIAVEAAIQTMCTYELAKTSQNQ